jgi:phage shock protein PspC (stress-responsive transcriptional regulator)
MILGVCTWLGTKLQVDPTLLRVGFVVAALAFGFGVGLYLILWLVKILSK